jgi:hypothetical protein
LPCIDVSKHDLQDHTPRGLVSPPSTFFWNRDCCGCGLGIVSVELCQAPNRAPTMDQQDTYHVEYKADTTHDENVAWLINDWSSSASHEAESSEILTFDVYESFNGL